MPAKRFRHLEGLLRGAEFVDVSDVLMPMRLRKSPAEIEVMRTAAGIADEAMRRAIATAVPGASSRRAASVASGAFVELGADFGRTGPITVGRGWNFMHGKLSGEPLAEGDVLHLELVPKVRGYCARLMRPAVMGEPAAELADAAAALVELQDRQIAAMVPGAEARAVDAIMREGAVRVGLRRDYVNNTGYTLGYYFAGAANQRLHPPVHPRCRLATRGGDDVSHVRFRRCRRRVQRDGGGHRRRSRTPHQDRAPVVPLRRGCRRGVTNAGSARGGDAVNGPGGVEGDAVNEPRGRASDAVDGPSGRGSSMAWTDRADAGATQWTP